MRKYERILMVRLTEAQYASLEQQASDWDMKPSTYVRHLITKQTKEGTKCS